MGERGRICCKSQLKAVNVEKKKKNFQVCAHQAQTAGQPEDIQNCITEGTPDLGIPMRDLLYPGRCHIRSPLGWLPILSVCDDPFFKRVNEIQDPEFKG